MRIPQMVGVIRRRLLVNYRVESAELQRHLPEPFTPQLHRGMGVAGICLIRLEQIRPAGVPAWVGLASENAAHRVAVQWADPATGQPRQGVYIPRRDTSSCLNALAGGRVFPGVHHHARFQVTDRQGRIHLAMTPAGEHRPRVEIHAQETGEWPADSIFPSLADASAFFEAGCVGYSARPDGCTLDGLKLLTESWRVTPLAVSQVHSAWLDDPSLFPPGSVQFDHALLMRDIPHRWQAEPAMQSPAREMAHHA